MHEITDWFSPIPDDHIPEYNECNCSSYSSLVPALFYSVLGMESVYLGIDPVSSRRYQSLYIVTRSLKVSLAISVHTCTYSYGLSPTLSYLYTTCNLIGHIP